MFKCNINSINSLFITNLLHYTIITLIKIADMLNTITDAKQILLGNNLIQIKYSTLTGNLYLKVFLDMKKYY